MRGSTRAGVAGILRAALAAALVLALAAPASWGRTRSPVTSTARRFQQAEARFRSLTESPSARRRPELWDQAAARFRAIVDASPAGPYAAASSYLLGEVYHERFHAFHEVRDIDRAIETYEGLLARYPRSRYADDALVQLGEIHYYQLGDAEQALRFYRRAIREHPEGDMTGRARVRAAAIEGPEVPSEARADSIRLRARPRPTVDTNEDTVGDRAAPARPLLYSPGAVIGGRTRVPAELLPRTLVPDAAEAPGDAEAVGEATAPPPPGRGEAVAPAPAADETGAPPIVPAEPREEPEAARVMRAPAETGAGVTVPPVSRPLNPLLEEGPIPLRTPADRLPVLTPAGPQSRAGFREVS